MAASKDPLVMAIAQSMPGWNEDTSEPEIEDARMRQRMESHWEAVNQECLRQAEDLAEVVRKTGLGEKWEYGVKAKLSEEAHGPDTYARMAMDSYELAEETAAENPKMAVIRRQVGEWEDV